MFLKFQLGLICFCFSPATVLYRLQNSHANEMIAGLHYFERKIKGPSGSLTKVCNIYWHIFTVLHWMQGDLSHEKMSVRLSNAYIVTKQKKVLPRFLHYMTDHLS